VGIKILIKPKYQVGDICYVKEDYYAYGHWQKDGRVKPTGHECMEFIFDESRPIFFDNDRPKSVTPLISICKDNPDKVFLYKRLGMHMFAKHARTYIRITELRAERLRDITKAGAIAEGIDVEHIEGHGYYPVYTSKDENGYYSDMTMDAVHSYLSLWSKINGQASTDSNPFVWVYKFEKHNAQ
jgi:hypothetical protein